MNDEQTQGSNDGNHKSSSGGGCLKGLAIGCLVMVILAVVGGVVVWRNAKSIMTTAGGAMANAVIDGSQLPGEQKTKLKTTLDGVLTDYKEGRITTEQLGEIVQAVLEGPMFPAATAYFMGQQYVAQSSLSEEEQLAAVRSIERFARGVFEKQIPRDQIDPAIGQIMIGDPKQRQVKQTLTDEELETFLETVKAAADTAGIADEAYEPDVAGEFQKLVDEATRGAVIDDGTGP